MKQTSRDNTYNNIFKTVAAPADRRPAAPAGPQQQWPGHGQGPTWEFIKTLQQEYEQRNNFYIFNLWTMTSEALEKFLAQLSHDPESTNSRIRYSVQSSKDTGSEYMFVPCDHPAVLFLQLITPAETVITANGEFYLATRAQYSSPY